MKSQTIEDLKKSSWKNISKHIQGLEKKGLVLNEVSNN
jgi:biotin operon repressor